MVPTPRYHHRTPLSMPASSTIKSAGDTPVLLEPFIGPETPSYLEGAEKQLEQAESRGEPYPPRDTAGSDKSDTAAIKSENEAPPSRSERHSETGISNHEIEASQPRATNKTMASRHTEPAHQHTKSELMHPGREQHLSSSQPCPDPSVHRDTKLQEQASSAALYVTKPNNKVEQPREEVQNILDANNRLSSRSE